METGRVLLSRDVIWLHKTYGVYHNLKPGKTTNVTHVHDDDIDDDDRSTTNQQPTNDTEDDEPIQKNINEQPGQENQPTGRETTTTTATNTSRLERELARLNTFYNQRFLKPQKRLKWIL